MVELKGSLNGIGLPAIVQLIGELRHSGSLELSKGLLLALHLARLKEAGTLRPEQVSVGKLNNVREAIAIARSGRAAAMLLRKHGHDVYASDVASSPDTGRCAAPCAQRER